MQSGCERGVRGSRKDSLLAKQASLQDSIGSCWSPHIGGGACGLPTQPRRAERPPSYAGALHERIQELEAEKQAARRRDTAATATQQRLESGLADSQVRTLGSPVKA